MSYFGFFCNFAVQCMDKFRKLIGIFPTGVLSGLTLALILWLTLVPHPVGKVDLPLFPGADKVAHAVMFGFLTLVILTELMKYKGWMSLSLPLIGLVSLLCAVFGIVVEVVQEAMGLGRTFETLDILADSAGAVIAGAIWAALQNNIAKT